MNAREFAIMRQVEDSHWWYAALREAVANELRIQIADRHGARILAAGCGTGGMMEFLRRGNPSWNISGLDISPLAVEYSRARGFPDVSEGSVNALPYADGSFDVVLSLDVLYFEGVDEARAMTESRRVLRPGGVLVLNLPAFDVLRGRHDVAVRGVRRYTPARVRDMVNQAGMKCLRAHCWDLWLFLPVLCWRWLSRALPPGPGGEARSDLSMPPALANAALTAMARLDMAFCRAIRSPLGTSVLAVAKKPGDD